MHTEAFNEIFHCCELTHSALKPGPVTLQVALGIFSPAQCSLLCEEKLQFISPYLHLAPSFSLQSAEQQGSASWYKRPGSHSSPSSTLEFPHTLLLRSLKHSWALISMVLWMDFLLQLENIYRVTGKKAALSVLFSQQVASKTVTACLCL